MMGSDGEADTAGPSPLTSLLDADRFAPVSLGQVLSFPAAPVSVLTEGREKFRNAAAFFGQPYLKARLAKAEQAVARCFWTVILINIGLGIAVALALFVLGLPLAYACGAGAAILNFLLYVGPAVMLEPKLSEVFSISRH